MGTPRAAPVETLRRLLAAIFAIGAVGAEAELLLLKHWADPWQLIPLILLPAALLVLGWHAWSKSGRAVAAFRVIMLLFVASCAAGILLHYRGDVEWKLEGDPSLHGFALLKAAVRGAIPLLAPGAMLQLGLLGLALTWRYPTQPTTAEE
jgi:hypothetical protein